MAVKKISRKDFIKNLIGSQKGNSGKKFHRKRKTILIGSQNENSLTINSS